MRTSSSTPVGDCGDEIGRDLYAVNLLQVRLDLPEGHASGVHRDDLVVEAVEARLPFLDELRLELGVTVAWDINVELAALAFDRLRGLAVAGVAGVVPGRVVRLIAEVMGQLALQRPLDHRLGELLQESVGPEHIGGRLIVFQQFV